MDPDGVSVPPPAARACPHACWPGGVFLAALVLPALLVIPAAGLAQGTAQEWQTKAVQKYPDLGVRGSALNQRFIAAVAERRRTQPGFFTDPRWPALLADELSASPAAAGAVAAPPAATPVPPALPATPPPAPAVRAAPTTVSAAPPVDFDPGSLPKGTGLVSAKFRWWSPPAVPVRGVFVLLEGRGGDSRGMVSQAEWQALAKQVGFGLVGAQLVNPPEDTGTFQGDPNGMISGLLNKAVNALLAQAGQKLKDPPLAFWGHSAGGNLTQQYMSRYASRVVGAVLMRATAGPGGLAPGKDDVPTLICVGGKDKPEWVKDALANYQRGRALRADWTLALNPNEGHEVGRTRALAVAHLLAAINLRLPEGPPAGSLAAGEGAAARPRRLDKQAAWLGDPTTYEVSEYEKYPGRKTEAVWLLDEATAKAWQQYLRGS